MRNKMSKYDRFNLEEEIQNVWQTKDDLNAITERIYDDPDGITRTPLGGFGNHSDTPNCFKIKFGQTKTWIGALRDIEPDEEITWKYTLYEIK